MKASIIRKTMTLCIFFKALTIREHFAYYYISALKKNKDTMGTSKKTDGPMGAAAARPSGQLVS